MRMLMPLALTCAFAICIDLNEHPIGLKGSPTFDENFLSDDSWSIQSVWK
jgi:hypothetical protein